MVVAVRAQYLNHTAFMQYLKQTLLLHGHSSKKRCHLKIHFNDESDKSMEDLIDDGDAPREMIDSNFVAWSLR